MQAVSQRLPGQVIAVDGKTLRRSHHKPLGKNAIHMVVAWASANHLVLGQRKVDEKSNEITAIPAFLQLLDISGCLVTIDAMGCQTDIAAQSVNQGATISWPSKATKKIYARTCKACSSGRRTWSSKACSMTIAKP
ncbi:MAG: ISAs1 family transposase [Chloroflexi bacterium]|nr:ISAs1 family transposase [Chloroflexota bacterium]